MNRVVCRQQPVYYIRDILQKGNSYESSDFNLISQFQRRCSRHRMYQLYQSIIRIQKYAFAKHQNSIDSLVYVLSEFEVALEHALLLSLSKVSVLLKHQAHPAQYCSLCKTLLSQGCISRK